MTSSDEEGFDEKLVLQVSKQIIYMSSPKDFVYKKKHILRSPRCIYPKVTLMQYPSYLDQLPISYFLSCNQESKSVTPLFSVYCEDPAALQLSYLCKKYQCVYNKLNENLQTKHDLTIFIKNIRTAVQVGMVRPFQKCAIKQGSKCNLIFESNFECGNLHSVFVNRNQPNVYYLCLQNDSNTHGYNQWFNFMVKVNSSVKNEFVGRFIILNHSKQIKYSPGMCVLTCQQTQSGHKWSYQNQFLYYKNKFQKYDGKNNHTIDFSLIFKPSSPPFTVCLSPPYTYSKLIAFLQKIKIKQFVNWIVDIEDIGKSQGSNRIYMVKLSRKSVKSKKCIFILARQHASQCGGSILCEKIIQKVLMDQNSGDGVDWILIPMANPDGVIHGNSRTNLKGYDINRCWSKQTMHLSSEVGCINSLIKEIRKQYKIECMWDLHGHSKQFNCFAYYGQKNEKSRYYNCLLKQKTCIYNFNKSKYGIGYKKRSTFRGQMVYRQHIKNVNTLEISYFGYIKDGKLIPMKISDFQQLAQAFVETLNQVHWMTQQQKLKLQKEVEILQKQSEKLQHSNIVDGNSTDSDSDPQGDYLKNSERKQFGLYDQNQLQQNLSGFQEKNKSQTAFDQFEAFMREQNKKRQTKIVRKSQDYSKQKNGKKPLRRPIYTNSYVQITPYLHTKTKQNKRYSLDQSEQLLNHRKRVNQSRKRRTGSQENERSSSFKKVNGNLMKSRPISVYPTASNVKINLQNMDESERAHLMKYKSESILEPKGWNFRERIKARPPKLMRKTITMDKKMDLTMMNKSLLKFQ